MAPDDTPQDIPEPVLWMVVLVGALLALVGLAAVVAGLVQEGTGWVARTDIVETPDRWRTGERE